MYSKLVLVSILGLFSARFVIEALGPSDFGLYTVVGSIVFMMAFLNNVMITTTYRFIAFEIGRKNISSTNEVFNVSLVIHIFLALLILILGETLGVYYINSHLEVSPDRVQDALFVFRLSIFSTLFNVLSIPYQGLLVAKENFSFSAIIEILRSLFTLIIVFIVLFFSGNRLRLYSLLICVLSLLPSILYYIYARKKYFKIVKWNFQKGIGKYKEMISFSGWVMFGAGASASEIQGSVLLINVFFGTVINASYGIANQVNTVVKSFAQSLNLTIVPKITKSFSGNEHNKMMKLVILTSKFSFFLILLPAIPILLYTDFILSLWIGNVPDYTGKFVQLFIVSTIVATMNAGIPAVIQASGRIKYFQLINGLLAICGLPISYYLFKLGSPPFSIAIVYLVISLVSFFINIIMLKKIIDFDVFYFSKEAYFKMVIVLLMLFPLALPSIFFSISMFRFIALFVFSEIWILLIVLLFGMSHLERKILILGAKNLLFKLLGQKNPI